ncbi:MAG: NADPH-dependent F420 reductase [Chloroflexota bacterium]
MTMKKPIVAVLGGTGKEGPGLALRWANAGYQIIIGSRQKEKADITAAELNLTLGIDTITGMENDAAARAADISVLTVVQSAQQAALNGLKNALQGKILADATARIDFRDPKPPAPPAAAEIAQEILGEGVRVVAAFQNVPAHALRKLDEPIDSDVLICSNDVDAAEQVIELAEAGGMKSFYAGGLVNAVTVEGLTAILISLNKFHKVKTASIGITGI